MPAAYIAVGATTVDAGAVRKCAAAKKVADGVARRRQRSTTAASHRKRGRQWLMPVLFITRGGDDH